MEEVKTIFVEGSYSHEIKIPSSWEFAPLHEVIELVGGSQPPKSVFKYEPEYGYVRLIQIRDYKSDDHKVYIPRDLARRFVSPDEVMIGRYGPPIFQILRGLEGAYNVALMKAVPVCDVFSKDYLFKYLSNKDLYNYVDSASDRTAGQSGVNKGHLEKYPVAVPPLAEQQQIAQKLDELLAQVDTLKTRLDAIPKILKRFRQSVLAAAVSGRLTEEWRESAKLESWIDSTFGEIGNVSGGLTKNSKRQSLALIKPYLRVANVHANNLKLDDVSDIGLTEAEFKKTKLEKGDLLIVEGNGSLEHIGRAAIWNGEIEECSHQNHLIRWRAKANAHPKFVLYQLLSPQGRKDLVNVAKSTTGLHTLSISKISSLYLPKVSFEEQTEIVRRVEQLFTYADQIEQRLKDAQARVNNLTQSILAKAFRGELTADWRVQNPELISGENSAAALLERIKAERALTLKPKRKTKT